MTHLIVRFAIKAFIIASMSRIIFLLFGLLFLAPPSYFSFDHYLIDSSLQGSGLGQTALADLDGDSRPEFVMGLREGEIFAYKYHSPDRWTRYQIGSDSPSDVGLAVLDIDEDGLPDLVTGGAWYQNSGDLSHSFSRHVFDPELSSVHDIVIADLDRDRQQDVLTMSDRNNLRWYRVPEDPLLPWERVNIGGAVHAGLSVGDVDGDGFPDVVRTNVWFENANGDGTRWIEHSIGPNTPPPPDFQPRFAFDATRTRVRDMNGDGKNDIVIADNEIPGGKVWWMENLDGKGLTWERHDIFSGNGSRRGAYHSLHVADFDGDHDYDVFSCEMEWVRGEEPPRWYIWENLDGKGGAWQEHVILDANLGGHEAVVGDVTGDGRLDIVSKPWRAHPENAVDGKPFVIFLENVSSRAP